MKPIMLPTDFQPRKNDMLLIIDLQKDFMEGGALAVEGGLALQKPILSLMREFELVVATQDWHPAGHRSFASSHEGQKPFNEVMLNGHPQTLWPDHCVQGSFGASLPAELMDKADLILRKGTSRYVDSYSAFRENYGLDGQRQYTGLLGWACERRVRRIVTVGLARDYCVLWSAQDSGMTIPTTVLWELTRAVVPANDAETLMAMRKANIEVVQ